MLDESLFQLLQQQRILDHRPGVYCISFGNNWNRKHCRSCGLQVDNARRKLSGEHPADVMLQELAAKHSHAAHWQALQAIVKGDANHNFRATVSGRELSVDEQVQCLLDQATDPNVLGRSWQGWKPWL